MFRLARPCQRCERATPKNTASARSIATTRKGRGRPCHTLRASRSHAPQAGPMPTFARLRLHLRLLQDLGNPPFFKIIHDARKSRLDTLKTPLHHRQGIGHKQKAVRLVGIKNFLNPVIQLGPFFLVGRRLRLFKQPVHLGVAVVGKIEPALKGLRRMPYGIQIRVLRDGPTQEHGVKAPLVDKFADKGRPLYGADTHVDADLPELRLHHGGSKYALLVALVGQNGKGQRLAVAV